MYHPGWTKNHQLLPNPSKKSLITLISTEYHLCNINDVHHRSLQQSLLTTMEEMGEAFTDVDVYRHNTFYKHFSTDSDSDDHDDDHHLDTSGSGASVAGAGLDAYGAGDYEYGRPAKIHPPICVQCVCEGLSIHPGVFNTQHIM
jgi:hypothetical protein